MRKMMDQEIPDYELNMYWPYLDLNKDGLLSKTEYASVIE